MPLFFRSVKEMNRKQKKALTRILIAAALLALANLLPLPFWLRCAVYAASWCVSAGIYEKKEIA